MAGRRRYKVGDHPNYDKMFDVRSFESPVLNPKATSVMNAGIVGSMNSRQGLESLLVEWKGDKNGHFQANGQQCPSKLKQAEDAIQKIQNDFAVSKQAQINSGKRPDKQMPADMLRKLHEFEALVDIRISEVSALEKALANSKDSDDKQSDRNVLARGPIGSGRMSGGILVVVDGQQVSKSADGQLFIDCKASPYHGMLTADYFDYVVKPWCGKRDQLRNEMREQCLENQRNGLPPGQVAFDAMPPIPPWPEQVKKLKEVCDAI